jgi:hypothetical protein
MVPSYWVGSTRPCLYHIPFDILVYLLFARLSGIVALQVVIYFKLYDEDQTRIKIIVYLALWLSIVSFTSSLGSCNMVGLRYATQNAPRVDPHQDPWYFAHCTRLGITLELSHSIFLDWWANWNFLLVCWPLLYLSSYSSFIDHPRALAVRAAQIFEPSAAEPSLSAL